LWVTQFLQSFFGVERMHLESPHVNEKTRADKFVEHLIIAQDMPNALAKNTFNTLSKFLDAIDVGLLHPPGAVRRVRRARFKRLDSSLHQKIPRHIRDQILNDRKRFHWLDRYRPIER